MSELSGFRLAILRGMNPDATHRLATEMRGALEFHSRWLDEFHKDIVCNIPFPKDIRLNDAHCHCAFGRWLAALDTSSLAGDAEVEDLRRLHESLHAEARELVRRAEEGKLIAPANYERFLEVHRAFSTRLNGLIYEALESGLQFDPLTGALGRSVMEPLVRREHLRAERTRTVASVAMVDIDHLKDLNDAYGHSFGDAVLGVAAKRFVRELRAYDLLFRYGGDEFLICLPNADLATAGQVLERLRGSLANVPLSAYGGDSVTVTASFGVAELGRGAVEQCVERADQALYRAKQAGRNQVIAHKLGA